MGPVARTTSCIVTIFVTYGLSYDFAVAAAQNGATNTTLMRGDALGASGGNHVAELRIQHAMAMPIDLARIAPSDLPVDERERDPSRPAYLRRGPQLESMAQEQIEPDFWIKASIFRLEPSWDHNNLDKEQWFIYDPTGSCGLHSRLCVPLAAVRTLLGHLLSELKPVGLSYHYVADSATLHSMLLLI